MPAPLTPSEQFTHDLCTQSFLAPWCYNNPIGKKGKELCDVLGVCDPDIVVFSVKDVGLADEDNHVHRKRWLREAVDASLRQLYGASKWLQSASHVIRNDGTQGLPLPPHGQRRIHRVAVAFGSRGKCSISSGDFGKGHVHVLTEQALIDVLTELDTITDFIHYLTAKEDLLTNNGGIVINGSEADLLGFYIHAGRAFPEKAGLLMIEPGIWDALRTKPEFIARKAEDRDSYTWDDLIDDLAGHDHRGLGLELSDRELVIRELARENRFGRRLLSQALVKFLREAKAGAMRSRIAQSPSLRLYVFAYFAKGKPREARIDELSSRCLIARTKFQDSSDVIIGIGFNEFDPDIGSATDLIRLENDTSSDEWRQQARSLEEEFGYFKGRPIQRNLADEFPVLCSEEPGCGQSNE